MIVDRFIDWAVARASRIVGGPRQVVTFEGDDLFVRYEFLRIDEVDDRTWDHLRRRDPVHHAKRPSRLPWWMPFNVFLHHWTMAEGVAESFHDHPRWSVTICIKGCLVEMTPWAERELRPGSVVFRSRKAIHAFRPPADYRGDAWTLFIVGRRRHRQNSYKITKR